MEQNNENNNNNNPCYNPTNDPQEISSLFTYNVDLEKKSDKPRTGKFSIQGRRFFLTYPNLPVELDANPRDYLAQTMEKVRVTFGANLKSCIVAWEHHKEDGGLGGIPHMHIAIELHPNPNNAKGVYSYTGQSGLNMFDNLNICGKHGDYQSARQWQRIVVYLTKEGNYAVHNIDVQAFIRAVKNNSSLGFEQVATLIQSGRTLKQIDEEAPGFVMHHLNRIQDYIDLQELFNLPPLEFNWYGIVMPNFGETNMEDYEIAKWLNLNIKLPRTHKQKQLWISGPANTGKTHLWMEILAKRLRVWVIPYDKDWYDGYSDDIDLVIFDEYQGQKQIGWLNAFVEGAPFPMPRRNKKPFMKRKNVPCIILSNRTMSECYQMVQQEHRETYDSFLIRWKEVKVTTQINLKPRLSEVNIPILHPLNPLPVIEQNRPLTPPLMRQNNMAPGDFMTVVDQINKDQELRQRRKDRMTAFLDMEDARTAGDEYLPPIDTESMSDSDEEEDSSDDSYDSDISGSENSFSDSPQLKRPLPPRKNPIPLKKTKK